LLARQIGYDPAPASESALYGSRPVQKIVETFGEGLCPSARPHGVAQGHFLEGEDQIGPRLDGYCVGRDPGIFPLA
jgi:hypothetical protein